MRKRCEHYPRPQLQTYHVDQATVGLVGRYWAHKNYIHMTYIPECRKIQANITLSNIECTYCMQNELICGKIRNFHRTAVCTVFLCEAPT